ncbi:flippase-like domain-containing protein [Frankia sp. AiPs1]|uniref:lysylphosphatidylglycerol synthase transmembrane domain-containing protein n=1 Tax=Frankia sp. AiPs1 TaxID=573493 RepID=UPI002043231A|nr:lysylphosphatidylglycerol synthase transmembrane domain-containing protein [Frankia sp. AiPs1]MCM3921684.1 flippase-like domain-containing protein [Frankia sp. AiPs1]
MSAGRPEADEPFPPVPNEPLPPVPDEPFPRVPDKAAGDQAEASAEPPTAPAQPPDTGAELSAGDVVPGGFGWARVAGRVVPLAATGVALYLLMPQLLAVFSAFPRLRAFQPLWYPAMVLLEAASFACVWQLQRIAISGLSWFLSVTSQLVSNSISRIVPGGIAVGGAVQFRMLNRGGCDPAAAGFALTATSMVTTGVVFGLPLVVLPAITFGQPAPAGLTTIATTGGLAFGLLVIVGVVLARSDATVRLLARVVTRLARLARRSAPVDLPDVLVARRTDVIRSLGRRWPGAVLTAAGKWGLDYLALLAALAGAGQHPRVSLVLLAYVAANVLAMIPITPGGLGFVEAGLTGTLALAGVPAAAAAVSTLAYRLVSFWLPLAAGAPAWVAYRVRYR